MLDERDGQKQAPQPLDFEKAVYGNFLNFVPSHHVFEGFESNDEFQQHLGTLLDWETDQQDGLANLGIQRTQEVEDLEFSMAHLI